MRLGNAIKPLQISASVHTAETVKYGPMKTAATYKALNELANLLVLKRYAKQRSE